LNESFATAVALEKSEGQQDRKSNHGYRFSVGAEVFQLGTWWPLAGCSRSGGAGWFLQAWRRCPRNLTPSVAVLWVGLAPAIAVFGGDAILIPVSEVGSATAAAQADS
jgi:hypothetical protein